MKHSGNSVSQKNSPTPGAIVLVLALVALFALGCNTVAPTPTTVPPTAAVIPPTSVASPVERQPIEDGPILLRDDITLRRVANIGGANIKLDRNPADNKLYYLHPDQGVFHIDVGTGDSTRVIARTDVVTNGMLAGMAFAQDGTLFLTVNQNVPPKETRAVIRKGTPQADGGFTWTTLAQTEPYPLAGNNFDHFYNGIVVSPDGQYVYVNAGSRSDHGEVESNVRAFPDVREVPLTSAILRIPSDAQDLVLSADEAALGPYLYADGTRNAYDPVFAPNGDLIVGDNGPDADFPDELNWIRQDMHYGFPWKFGVEDNPQRNPDYNPIRDPHLQSGFMAVDNDFYHKDPTFPPPPKGVTFTEPIINLGPEADHYRADDGSEKDSSNENKPIQSFTPHRSPLGLAFVTDPGMPADMQGNDTTLGALITSWGAAAGTLEDRGADILLLKLTKAGDNYQMTSTQIAREFDMPIDGVFIGNKYYLLEWGGDGAIWELTFGK